MVYVCVWIWADERWNHMYSHLPYSKASKYGRCEIQHILLDGLIAREIVMVKYCARRMFVVYILQWTQASATFLKWLFGNEFTWFCAVHIWLFRENEKDSQTNYKPHNISECVRYLRQNSVNSDFYVHLVICFAQQSKTPAKFSIQSHTRTVSNWRNNDSCSNLETKSWNLKCP